MLRYTVDDFESAAVVQFITTCGSYTGSSVSAADEMTDDACYFLLTLLQLHEHLAISTCSCSSTPRRSLQLPEKRFNPPVWVTHNQSLMDK